MSDDHLGRLRSQNSVFTHFSRAERPKTESHTHMAMSMDASSTSEGPVTLALLA